jgi:hypothetical protein
MTTVSWPTNDQLVFSSDEGQHSELVRRALRALALVRYKDDLVTSDGTQRYQLRLVAKRGHHPYMQVSCLRPDSYTHIVARGFGAKMMLTDGQSDSQIIKACFGLFKAYEEHEAREGFTYAGARVFGPHISVEALISVADAYDTRAGQRD